MANPNFEIAAVWDDEAKVWISESDIVGLHIEAATLEEFEKEVREHAAYLIVENHYTDREIDRSNLRELIPTIFWREGKPRENAA